jgi:predicted ArsR family transcriptional regulator
MSQLVVSAIRLTKRQEGILKLVKEKGPITGEEIGANFNLSRATLRPDLAILTMSGLLDLSRPPARQFACPAVGDNRGKERQGFARCHSAGAAGL